LYRFATDFKTRKNHQKIPITVTYLTFYEINISKKYYINKHFKASKEYNVIYILIRFKVNSVHKIDKSDRYILIQASFQNCMLH